MGTTRPIKERAIDSLFNTNSELIDLIGCAIGLQIGEKETGIFYISDTGEKKAGRCYMDGTNGKLYKCTKNTTSTSNTTANFTELNMNSHSDRLDNLIKIEWFEFQSTDFIKEFSIPPHIKRDNIYSFDITLHKDYAGYRSNILMMISPSDFRENSENMGIFGITTGTLQRYKIAYRHTEHKIAIEEPSDWSLILVRILYFV